jgi:hypothetical protein
MTTKTFLIGIASLYGIGLAVALSIAASQQSTPTSLGGWLAVLPIPLIWGAGPTALTVVWLVLKRLNLNAAKFGLLVFAGLYLAMVLIRWWWQALF